jgi:transcriptional regulator with XRE-family HTH domain
VRMEALAERLRVLRAKRGLGLVEAADRIGVERHTLRDLERGTRPNPRHVTLQKLARFYGVPVEALLVPDLPLPQEEEEQPALPLEETPWTRPLSEVAGETETGHSRALRMVEAMLVRVSKAAGDKLEKWGRGAAASSEAPREAADVLQEVLTAPDLEDAADHGELPQRSQEQYELALIRLEKLRELAAEVSPERATTSPGDAAADLLEDQREDLLGLELKLLVELEQSLPYGVLKESVRRAIVRKGPYTEDEMSAERRERNAVLPRPPGEASGAEAG